MRWMDVGAQIPNCEGTRFLVPVFDDVDVSTVAYGQNYTHTGALQTLRMDIYRPRGDSFNRRPVIVWAYGGSFTAGIRQSPDIVRLCREFARRGYVCASIDYRLGVDNSGPPEQTRMNAVRAVSRAVHDARAAIRWLRKSFVESGNPYGIDTSQIFAGGVSAGGFIAAHLLYMDAASKILEFADTTGYFHAWGGLEGNSGNPGYSSAIKGAINLCGALGKATWIDPGDPFIISLHGDRDGTVPYGHDEVTVYGSVGLYVDGSYVIDSVARARGVHSYLYTYRNMDHVPFVSLDVGQILQNGIINEPVMQVTVEFIAEKLFNHLDCTTLGYFPVQEVSRASAWTRNFDVFASRGLLFVRRYGDLSPTTLMLTDIWGRTVLKIVATEAETQIPIS
ncbi:MAG: alpha/beta hydrolase, partial [Bacteroidia bacterium]|nr:alpha/beta hydrolase [Bacteroidia bacterium]MDW8334248.1 alpha/beta hydrolase [Bacteroidia bacterium]